MPISKKNQSAYLTTFFVGVLMGFFLCQQAGKVCSKWNCYGEIKRFSVAASPSANFFPTPTQMLALALERRKSKEQILVIVGGSSTFMGMGQTLDELWSDHLQELLGPQFCVVNLAQRGSPLAGSAMVVAEALVKRGERVIYIANTSHQGGPGVPDGDPPYQYVFWDGLYKKMLLDYPPRIKRLWQNEAQLKVHKELAICSWLDSRFYFEDLWTAVAYKWFATNWSPMVRGHMFRARITFPDGEEKRPLDPNRFHMDEDRLVPQLAQLLETKLKERRANAEKSMAQTADFLRTEINWAIPPGMRPNVLAVLVSNSPHYIHKLPKEEADLYLTMMGEATEIYKGCGIHSVHTGFDYGEDDYKDFVHMTASGGRKLAEAVAPAVRDLGTELYFKQ